MQEQTTDDELLAQCYITDNKMIQELAKRLEQRNEQIELLQEYAGCGSFPELAAFVQRHADDGK